MSTIVYQELLQSNSYESHIGEPRTLSLKLTNLNTRSMPSNTKAWDAIEALTSSSIIIQQGGEREKEKEAVYVHPLAKRSSSKLSEKSLEMCTESLGSETGAFIMESSLFSFSSSTTNTKKTRQIKSSSLETRNNKTTTDNYHHGSNNISKSFPPPLTTMSGSNSIQVRPFREDGRLVIKAVSAPPTQTYLQAERSDGRLRLSMVRDCSVSDIDQIDESPSDNQVSPSKNQVSMCENVDVRNYEDEGKEEDVINEEDVVKEEEHIMEGKESGGVHFGVGEDMNGITLGFGVKMGMGDFHQRLSRCKEGGRGNNKRLINWEAFWVAT